MDTENFEGIFVDDNRSKVLAIRDQVFAMGNNDSEKSRFDEILAGLENDSISGDKAIEEANSILNSKIMR